MRVLLAQRTGGGVAGVMNSRIIARGRLPSLARSSFSCRRRSFSSAKEALSASNSSVGK